MKRLAVTPSGINQCIYCGATNPDSEANCPNTGGRHTLVSSSDKEVQGQGYGPGPGAEKPGSHSWVQGDKVSPSPGDNRTAGYRREADLGILDGPEPEQASSPHGVRMVSPHTRAMMRMHLHNHHGMDHADLDAFKDDWEGDHQADHDDPNFNSLQGPRLKPHTHDDVLRQSISYRTHERSQKTAHGFESPDDVSVRHCPKCFVGSTRYITSDGVKSLIETVGTVQRVLSADPDQRTSGRWTEAEIREFGEQPILRVTLQRNQITKVIEATPEHRWLVKANLKKVESPIERTSLKGLPRGTRSSYCGRGHLLEGDNVRIRTNGQRRCLVCAKLAAPAGGKNRSTDYSVLTKDLKPGYRLSYLRQEGVGDLIPQEAGVRHGIVFGDGTASGKGATVDLWGEKDKQLLKFFPGRKYREINTATRSEWGTGVSGVRVSGGLSSWMKDLPTRDDREYLYGWLAGYFAADGCVSEQGAVQLSSAKLANLEAARDIALKVGISTYGISSKMREGFPGREPSMLYYMNFVTSTLNDDFFLIEEHLDRFRFRNYEYERIGWTVVSVEETGRIEKVYCAVVPNTHSFALEDHIWVGNCGSGNVWGRSDGSISCEFCGFVFSVQAQPEYPQMAQNMEGTPLDPGTGAPIPSAGGSAGGGGMLEDAPMDEEEDDDDVDEGSPEDEENQGKESGLPFQSSRRIAFLLTHEGNVLPTDDAINYLAIRHAADKAKMAKAVKVFNQGRVDG